MKEKPIVIIRLIKELREKKSDLFKIVESDKCLLKFVSTIKDTNYFFEVRDFEVSKNVVNVNLGYKPYSVISSNARVVVTDTKNVDTFFRTWETLLAKHQSYEDSNEPLAEPKANEYEYADYEDIEQGVNEYCTVEEINQIDKFLLAFQIELERVKTLENRVEFLEIANEINEIRNAVTVEDKPSILKRFSKIFKSALKLGMNVVDFINSIESASGAIEYVKKLLGFPFGT